MPESNSIHLVYPLEQTEQPYALPFEWTEAAGVEKSALTYRLVIATDPALSASAVVYNQAVPEPRTFLGAEAKLPIGKQLYWKIEAVDAAGSALATSPTGTFRTYHSRAYLPGFIEGTVTNASGAPIPYATVYFQRVVGGAKSLTATTWDGLYRWMLWPAEYDVWAVAAGYASSQKQRVTIDPLKEHTLNFMLS